MDYGFQRLVLLGSAGYERAELPLDAAVSLVAPNNTGKTSLINALQFLLIVDKRRMDFGAHDVEKSRRFYFPTNSAYILLEVALPTTGTVVVGCVGKGVSHDYEYFAYKGQLDIEDYRINEGAVVTQPQLKAHLASRGKLAFTYSSGEFSGAIYGNRRKRQDHEPDIAVFRLEHSSHAEAFQRVLTRTLRLDRLRASEVKEYLLSIFRSDLPDATIDFKAEWDKAFADVNAERSQYLAANGQLREITALEQDQLERLTLRGKLLHVRPLIDAKLAAWDQHYGETRDNILKSAEQVEHHLGQLRSRDIELAQNQLLASQRRSELETFSQRHHRLQQHFALIPNRRELEARHTEAKAALEAQIGLVQQASQRGPDTIRRERRSAEQERSDLHRELLTLTDNLYLRLKAELSSGQVELLNSFLDKQVMTLGTDEFRVDPHQIPRFAKQLEELVRDGRMNLPGLSIGLGTLIAKYTQRTPEELAIRIAELDQQIDALSKAIEAAQQMDAARRLQADLDKTVREIEQDLNWFDEKEKLDSSATARAASLMEVESLLTAIDVEQKQSVANAQRVREQERANLQALSALEAQHKDVVQRREARGDDAPVFPYLAEQPHLPWIAGDDFDLDRLAEHLDLYRNNCRKLLRLNDQIPRQLTDLRAKGLTKFAYTGSEEAEITRIIEFAAHLPQEAEALERKARTAVVNVTACLRELRDGLVRFKNRMREFNRLISRRQLSDLSVFKIEPADETHLVDSIEILISKAEAVDSGETFALFNHASVLDDEAINRAKQFLIREGEARGCLNIEHLFRLEFVVGKAGVAPESFADFDSAASTGTVLMAKMITGLALLHLMQDKRYPVQAAGYLDEASQLDQNNQASLIATARDFGFTLILASPSPLVTAKYCVPITNRNGANHISRQHWQIIETLEEGAA
jgi:hypothetical protein